MQAVATAEYGRQEKIMSDNAFHTFPKDKFDALTMLYLKNQDVSELSPEELLDKYDETYERIKNYYKEKRKNQKSTFYV